MTNYNRLSKPDLIIMAEAEGLDVKPFNKKNRQPTKLDLVNALSRKHQRRPHLLEIPGELRNAIYRELLVIPPGQKRCHPAILASCRRISEEATAILYEENELEIMVSATEVQFLGKTYEVSFVPTKPDSMGGWTLPESLRRVVHLRITTLMLPYPYHRCFRAVFLNRFLYMLCAFLSRGHSLLSLHIDAQNVLFRRPDSPRDSEARAEWRLQQAAYPLRMLGTVQECTIQKPDGSILKLHETALFTQGQTIDRFTPALRAMLDYELFVRMVLQAVENDPIGNPANLAGPSPWTRLVTATQSLGHLIRTIPHEDGEVHFFPTYPILWNDPDGVEGFLNHAWEGEVAHATSTLQDPLRRLNITVLFKQGARYHRDVVHALEVLRDTILDGFVEEALARLPMPFRDDRGESDLALIQQPITEERNDSRSPYVDGTDKNVSFRRAGEAVDVTDEDDNGDVEMLDADGDNDAGMPSTDPEEDNNPPASPSSSVMSEASTSDPEDVDPEPAGPGYVPEHAVRRPHAPAVDRYPKMKKRFDIAVRRRDERPASDAGRDGNVVDETV